MVLPRPWCGNDPRPCAKAVGIIDILISVVWGVILVTLPFVMLDLDHEIDYIKQHQAGHDKVKVMGSLEGAQIYILNITDAYRNDCNDIERSLKQFLDEYLKGKTPYNLNVNRTDVEDEVDENNVTVSSRILCEIHVKSKESPIAHVVEVKGKKYSIASICAQCLSQFTGEPEKKLESRFRVIRPEINEIASAKVYPGRVGQDPARVACLNGVIRSVKKEEVLKTESFMYTLFSAAAIVSLSTGFLITSTAFIVSRLLLLFCFLMEVICVGLIAGGLLVLNVPILCLYQYGGISVYARDSPHHMQTLMTYAYSVYAASVKFYILWFIIAYAEMAPSLEPEEASPMYSDYVADVALEVEDMNQALAEDTSGSKGSEDHDDSSDDDSDEDYDEYRPLVKAPPPPPAKMTSKGGKADGSVSSKSKAKAPAPTPKEKLFVVEDDDDEDDNDIDLYFKTKGKIIRKPSSIPGHTSSDSKNSEFRQRQKSMRPGAGRGPENTLVPQGRKDKHLFQSSFFGSHHT